MHLPWGETPQGPYGRRRRRPLSRHAGSATFRAHKCAGLRLVSSQEIRTVLTRVGWLSLQSESFQAEVLRRGRLVHYAANEPLFLLGDPPGGVYGIVRGAVTVMLSPPTEIPRPFHIGLAGSWIGEGPFLTGEDRRVSMYAAIETWAVRLSLEAMEQIVREDPAAMRCFIRILAMNLDILVRAFYDIQDPDDERRVALALLRLSTDTHGSVPLTQAVLGEMSGVSRKRVNAALKRLVAGGYVAKGYRSITVRNASALSELAHREEAY